MQNVLRLVFFVLFPVPFSSICAVDWILFFFFSSSESMIILYQNNKFSCWNHEYII